MPLNVHDFADHENGKYGFGVDRALTAASLRKIADAIESEDLLPQGAEVHGIASVDDFTLTTLRITFAERICNTQP